MNDLRHTAIHEAGHAVIGRVLGMTCGGASIVADEDSAGQSFCEDPLITAGHWRARGRLRGGHPYRLLMRGRIMAFMAGADAETVLLGECQGGDGDDRYQIEKMAESSDCDFRDEQWQRREPRMRAMTRMLIMRHRSKIERVAAALIEQGELSEAEIDRLL